MTSALLLAFLTIASTQAEVIREVRVHGNHTTPEADILALAGLSVGMPATDATLAEALRRLEQSGRFSDVEVRKRFRSIADPTDILVVVLVDERVGVTATDLTPGPLRRLRVLSMWLPVLDYDDGYGFTYGAWFSLVDVLGERSRISMPLTWGGERQAAVALERRFECGPLTRVEGAVGISRRENPHFETGDTRRSARVRAERSLTSWLRAGGDLGVTGVSFGSTDESHTAAAADVIVDTRRDPAFPRNAVHVTAAVEHLSFSGRTNVNRRTVDARGYIGLIGSSVLALRAMSSTVTAPLPPYEQRLLGGASLLRGYRAGHRADDNLAAVSAEVRVPLTSPLSLARFGVKTFADYGTVYPHGETLGDQPFDRGIGGGVFLTATVFRMGLDVAWPRQGSARWHFSLGVSF